MSNFCRLKLLVFILMLLLFIQSCAGMKGWISPKSPEETSASVNDRARIFRRSSPKAADPGKKYMKRGEYQKAIDTYNIEYRNHPHDEALLSTYVKSIKGIKSTADKAFEKKDFTSAAKNYNLLLSNYPLFKEFEKMLSFNSTHLNEKLCYCKKAITKKGFQEYRKGNLSEAILLWEGLLAIDPDNTDIKKSLRTARLQQKNLEEK